MDSMICTIDRMQKRTEETKNQATVNPLSSYATNRIANVSEINGSPVSRDLGYRPQYAPTMFLQIAPATTHMNVDESWMESCNQMITIMIIKGANVEGCGKQPVQMSPSPSIPPPIILQLETGDGVPHIPDHESSPNVNKELRLVLPHAPTGHRP